MKKTLLIIGLLFTIIFSVNAQENSKNTIGIRFGNNLDVGGEISYQRLLNTSHRLEINVGFKYNDLSSISAIGLYQWVFELDNNFNWYVGAGFGNASSTFLGVGTLGVEYNFDIPLLISLDIRPQITLNRPSGIYDSDLAFSFRYQF